MRTSRTVFHGRWLATIGCLALLLNGVGDGALVETNSALHTLRPPSTPAHYPAQVHIRPTQRALPLSFELNTGQTDEQVMFLARADGYRVFLTHDEAVFALESQTETPASQTGATTSTVMRLRLVGAQSSAQVVGLEPLKARSHYFRGAPDHWRTDVPTYGRVKYSDVYPGIDLVYRGNQRQLEYDFVVAPQGDPNSIRISFAGVKALRIDGDGALVADLAGRQVVQHTPVIYQESDGMRQQIPGRYVLKGQREVTFDVAAYDKTRPLVIDPVFVYSTFLGGTEHTPGVFTPHAIGTSIAVDAAGNAYVAGATDSSDFPTVNAFQSELRGGEDAFIAKFTPDGALEYSTFLGGSIPGGSGATGISVDPYGSIFIVGSTNTADFPITPGAYAAPDGQQNSFVTKLSPDGGALVYSTIVPKCTLFGISIDSTGRAWLTGFTERQDLPTVSPLQPGYGGNNDAVVMKLDAQGTALLYSTYLGGAGVDRSLGIIADQDDGAYLVGYTRSIDFPAVNAFQPMYGGGYDDCWIARINTQGSALLFSTFLGGSDDDLCQSIALDNHGDAVIVGLTHSADFPTRNPLQSQFRGGDVAVAKFHPTGDLVYSTFLGGSDEDEGFGVAVDAHRNVYVTGVTLSTDFPSIGGMQAFAGPGSPTGVGDGFIAKLNAHGSAVVYSTYLGGSGFDLSKAIAVTPAGSAYVTGATGSFDFPVRNGVQPAPTAVGEYAFVSRFVDGTCAQDITAQVDVIRLPVQSFFFGLFKFEWVLVHNKATVPIQGPLTLLLGDMQNAALVSSPLTSSCFSAQGDPFTLILAGQDRLFAPNEISLAGLFFVKTRLGTIRYVPHVLSGIPTE